MEGGSSQNCQKILAERSKISYTREFLLSFSESEECQKLPSRFDKSLLSELEYSHQELSRTPNSFLSQNYRRVEHSSSPPNRGDTNNISRIDHGRWDSRQFNSKVDRDNYSQSEFDSDTTRPYGNPARRPWQVREQDGLLGSGSFPRPLGNATKATVPNVRSGDNSLNRISQAYQPPRPYKAISVSRRDNNDSYNDETFSSSENTSEDRVEEERKRRASFELMRKEQYKTFHEKQKTGKLSPSFDIGSLTEEKRDESGQQINKSSDETSMQHVSHTDFSKSSVSAMALPSRPAIPPGFASAVGEKNMNPNALSHSHPLTVPEPAKEKKLTEDPSSNFSTNQNLDQSTSILDNLFNNLSLNESPHVKGVQNIADSAAPQNVNPHSSKFAQWFVEDGKSLTSYESHLNGPDNLLSLINGGEARTSKPETLPAIMTCEDLEQSIMSEAIIGNSPLPPSAPWCSPDSIADHHKDGVDNRASQHLLSLLQRGPKDVKVEDSSTGGNALTLESLFGTAFMKELKSGSAEEVEDADSGTVVMDNDIRRSNQTQIGNSENDILKFLGVSGSRTSSFDEPDFPSGDIKYLSFLEERNLVGSHGVPHFPQIQSRDSNLHQPSSSHLLHQKVSNSGMLHMMASPPMMFMHSDKAVNPNYVHPNSVLPPYNSMAPPQFHGDFPRGVALSHHQNPIPAYSMQGFPFNLNVDNGGMPPPRG